MDIRITKTKKSIINSFLELRSKKAIEKITVKEICEKAEINKSTFYTHFKDIYDLTEYLEAQIASDVISNLQNPEHLFSNPDRFIWDLFYAYASQERLIRTVFSGSRANMLIVRIESSLKKIIFSLRPEYKDNVNANVLFTFSIYGSYYAYEKCRYLGEEAVFNSLSQISTKIMELLN